MIKAVCFDLDGVYFTKGGMVKFKDAIVGFGASREKVDYVLHDSPEMAAFKRGETTENKFWSFACRFWGIKKTKKEIEEVLVRGYEIDKKVDALIKKVRKSGYKTCVVSNNYSTRIGALEKKFHFLKNFDIVVLSFKVGVTKPDKKIFKILLGKAKIKPGELAYSDDNEEKLGGARELGIQTFIYNDFNSFTKRLKALGVRF
ncbi:MAG: HAD-IA family hydrolase [bacterium]|nr:HAD-IA family hydrolase [bacterium]